MDTEQDSESESELERLRRERDELAARVESLATPRARGRRLRRTVVGVLVVIGILSFTLSAVGWWARRNVTDTDVWLARVGPLADDPAVHAALGRWMSDEVLEVVDPESLFVEVLPERGQLLAGPLAGAVEGFIRDRIDHFLASDRFEQLWLAVNERAHRAVIRVLRGESEVVTAAGDADHVIINLVPVINAVLADIGSASPELFGRQVDLPNLTVDDLPEDAIRRLEGALGVQLDDDFGQFEVYDGGRLAALQEGVEQARHLLILLSVMTVMALGVALWLSDRRRRTLLQMLAGLAIGLALIRRLGLRGQRELLNAIPDQVNRNAAEAVSDRFLDPLLAVTQTLLIVLAVVAAAAVVSGPYPWAERLRHNAARLVGGLAAGIGRGAAADSADRGPAEWVTAHRSQVQIGGVALALLVLLVFDLSFLGLVILGLLVAAGWFLLDVTGTSPSGANGTRTSPTPAEGRTTPSGT